jgi:hypothetical protein
MGVYRGKNINSVDTGDMTFSKGPPNKKKVRIVADL